jgi:hypothetical protein
LPRSVFENPNLRLPLRRLKVANEAPSKVMQLASGGDRRVRGCRNCGKDADAKATSF